MLEDFVPYPCLSLPYFPSFLLPPGKFGSSGLRETFAAQIPQAPALGLTFPIPTPSPSQLEKFQGCACCFLAGLGLHTCPAQRKNSGFPKMLWLSASTPLPAFSLSVPYLFPPIPCLLLVPALPPPKATPEVLPGTFLLAGMVTAHPGHACRMLASGKGFPGDPVLQHCGDSTHSPLWGTQSLSQGLRKSGCLQQKVWKMRSVLSTSDVGPWSFSCLAGNSIPKDVLCPDEGTRGARAGGHLHCPFTHSWGMSQ